MISKPMTGVKRAALPAIAPPELVLATGLSIPGRGQRRNAGIIPWGRFAQVPDKGFNDVELAESSAYDENALAILEINALGRIEINPQAF